MKLLVRQTTSNSVEEDPATDRGGAISSTLSGLGCVVQKADRYLLAEHISPAPRAINFATRHRNLLDCSEKRNSRQGAK